MDAKKKKSVSSIPEEFKMVFWLVGGIVLLYIIFAIIKFVFKFLGAIANNAAHKASSETVTYEDGSVDTINYSDIATRIYNAFYKNDWFSFTEDEDAAVSALKMVPKDKIQKLANTYSIMYQEDLYSDFRNFVEDDYYKIADLLN